MGKFDRFFDEPSNKKIGKSEERVEKTRAPGASSPAPIAGLPTGDWIAEGVYRLESRYRFSEPFGNAPLRAPDEIAVMRAFGATGRIVFLDLETTGLSGGTGTYAFLCGIGVTAGDFFNVVQFFLEGPAYEAEWLRAIDAIIPADSTIATYNGKAFDLPLLRTRHVLARSEPVWGRMPHIDILHLARRFYKGHLPSCSLGSMERNVLGVRRSGEDIPGALIPEIYARYLRSRDAAPLAGVFYHNELDIASLAALYGHLARLLEGDCPCGRTLQKAGDVWHALGDAERANALWARACASPDIEFEARARRAYRAKRARDYEAAREDFLFLLAALTEGRIASHEWVTVYSLCEELAKLEEHRFRSPERAIAHTERAVSWLKRNRYLLGHAFAPMHRAMQHRRERLQKKLQSQTPSDVV